MMKPLEKARKTFESAFGTAPAQGFFAPGRVNLIGEHTDYNNGFVLPAALDVHTVALANPRDDNQVTIIAADLEAARDQFDLTEPITPSKATWANYPRGLVKSFLDEGHRLKGADIVVSGNIPQGAGLSSSAALEVALGETFRSLNDLALDQTDLARLGQQAENKFVGTQCGIMDQLVSAKGEEGHALLIDCRSLETKPVPVPSDLKILIINSNVRRGLVESKYNDRRHQCEEAARDLGVSSLRDIDRKSFRAKEPGLTPLLARRARHVITETTRTLEAAEALERNDVSALSHLMAASHASMRDDFEITVPPIDHIVSETAAILGDQGGVRMTGGGFGGCVVALVPDSLIEEVKKSLERSCPSQFDLTPTFYIAKAGRGSGPLSL